MKSIIEEILKQSGWKLGRKVEITDIKKMYDYNEYIYNLLQINFVMEYAYLEIKYQHPVWKQEVKLSINPVVAQKMIDMDSVKEYEEFFSRKFLIVGEIEKENMTIFIDELGELYGVYDDCVIKWGNDFHKMLNSLVSGTKGELIMLE